MQSPGHAPQHTGIAAADIPSPTLLESIESIAREAGAMAMGWFRSGSRTGASIDWKTGGSPVTEADMAVDAFLTDRLRALVPDAGWMSEETADTPDRLTRRKVFIVDPIDGTRGFMEGDPRFAVSIALVIDGRPVAGFVEAPALKQTFSAVVGQGAFCNGVRLAASGRATPEGGLLAGPKMLIDKMAPRLRMSAQPKVPSLAVRFAHVASGALDAGIATPNSHDWDIAAADLVLAEAGGRLTSLDGRGLIYNRAETRHGALLAAPKALHDEILSVLAAFAGPEKDGQSRAPAQIER